MAVTQKVGMVTTDASIEVWEHLLGGHGNVMVVGAPGAGKTQTLRAIETRADLGQTPVRRVSFPTTAAPLDLPERPGIVLIDDVHLLLPEDLDRWLDAVDASASRLVASIRPDALDRAEGPLLTLAGHSSTIVLEAWSESEVEALLRWHPEVTMSAGNLLEATGGLPWLLRDQIAIAASEAAIGAPTSDGRRNTSMTPLDRHVLRRMRDLPDLEADLVLAIAAGYPSHGEPVAPVLRGLSAEQVRSVSDRLWHGGLVTMNGTMPTSVRDSLGRHAPSHRFMPLLMGLVDDLSATGASLHDVAETFVRLGIRDGRMVSTLAMDASRDLATHPEVAARLYAAALRAGGAVDDLAAPHAEALALSGDFAAASTALVQTTPDKLSPDGLRIALTLSVLSGQPKQAARLAQWAKRREVIHRSETARACAALALTGTGDARAAAELLARDTAGGPGLIASPLPDMCEAVLLSLGSESHLALPTLVRVAASTPARHRREFLPDLPATLAALVALHCGDLAIAESVLADASAGTVAHSGSEMTSSNASRSHALRGWVSMLAGRYVEAREHLREIDPRVPRDQPWAWGLRLGLARRQDDVGGLAALWPQARSALVGHPVDLYSLLPLGEVGLAAARMHEPELAAPVWGEASALLGALGDPPVWSAAFHWYAVQAAVLTDRPDTLAPHARALVVAARTNRVAATYAAAGRAWVAVLARDVDAKAVIESARALRAVGQAWEGSRLAGHGAARTSDRKDAALLLECARDLLHTTSSVQAGIAASRPTASEVKAGVVVMSDRELEVAKLVLANLTYQQIGEKLFLSARTVEHHMARIKQRSGAKSRADLLARLSVTVNAHEDASGSRPSSGEPAP